MDETLKAIIMAIRKAEGLGSEQPVLIFDLTEPNLGTGQRDGPSQSHACLAKLSVTTCPSSYTRQVRAADRFYRPFR